MMGGSYKKLIEKFPAIIPNSRLLQYLRVAEKSAKESELDKIFI